LTDRPRSDQGTQGTQRLQGLIFPNTRKENSNVTFSGLRIGLVGPLPPPAGGMANQTLQLADLLAREGAQVTVVRTNSPYKPAWVEQLRVFRALFRLLPFLFQLWRTAGRVDLFHVMANSGWSWHLFAAPAVVIAKLRGKPVVVNYRGGDAEKFFARSFFWVKPVLTLADEITVPSGFLQAVFARRDFKSTVVPNIINLSRFSPKSLEQAGSQDIDRMCAGVQAQPSILVARNLEPIYDNATALRAFATVLQRHPQACLTVCGTGGEMASLVALASELGIAKQVEFAGQISNSDMAALYRQADILVNPSLVDNMPISLLEALATGVPIVSTNVGGIPYLVENDRTALLVNPKDDAAMAQAILTLLADPGKVKAMHDEGLRTVRQYAWASVREQLHHVYRGVLACKPSYKAN
jgi:L-malate glycosyltransferase